MTEEKDMVELEPIIVKLQGDADETLIEIENISAKNGIYFSGGKKGSFSTGFIKGKYEVTEGAIMVVVSEKPKKVRKESLKNILTDLFSANDSRDYREIFDHINLYRL